MGVSFVLKGAAVFYGNLKVTPVRIVTSVAGSFGHMHDKTL